MRDWLSEGHLAWFIVDAVGQMDLSMQPTEVMAGVQRPIIHPVVRLLPGSTEFQAHSPALEDNQQPDFRTICRFTEHVEKLFVDTEAMP